MLNLHPHLPREGCPALQGSLCCPSLKDRNYSLPVPPRAQHPFLYDSASPSVSEPESTLTPVGIFSFPIPKSALVQWGRFITPPPCSLAPCHSGGTAAQAIFQGPAAAMLGWHMGTVSQQRHRVRMLQHQISAPCPAECLREVSQLCQSTGGL